jgi:xanthine dehydrogenase YagR molybdenum-binding subunit
MPDTTTVKKKTILVPKVVDGQTTMVEMQVDDVNGPEWGANADHRILNKRIPRVDGPAKVSGAAVYTYDAKPAGMLFGRLLRCPYGHANVKSFDASAALKIPGVVAVIQAEKAPIYEGAPVAAVAAISPEIAADAIHAIDVQYDVLPCVVKAEDAIKDGAPQVYPDDKEVTNNIRHAATKGNAGAVADALDSCDAVVEADYRTPTLHHACLESHGVVVDYRGGATATVYASTQGTFTIPGDAAKTLGLKRGSVTSIVQYMGGGFGAKFGIGIEGRLACQLSKQTRQPVKMMLTRVDEFLLSGNGSGSWQTFKGGANKDGTFVAINARQYMLGGIGRGSLAGAPYVYKCQHVYREVGAVHTNEDAAVAMRAPGHPPVCFATESLMDELAYKIGMDPLEFRRKNLTDRAWLRQLDRGAREIGWERRNPSPGAAPGPLVRGMGCAVSNWGGGGGPQCKVDVKISQGGAVDVLVGSQDLGTGTRTYVRAIVAEDLGLEMSDVQEHIGSSKLGAANSSGGSTTAASLSPAVKDAVYNARQDMAARVAPLLGTTADKIIFDSRAVSGNGKTLSWKQACAALPAAGLTAHGVWKPGLSGNGVHGVCFAEVEVDIETGHVRVVKMVAVQDVGLPLNRLAIESQINGGMVQGIGMALLECRTTDAKLGVMCNPGFGDYKIPGALEIPEMLAIIDDEDPRNTVIGVGEPPSIHGSAAIANAVYNACGVRVRDLPITPDKILNGLSGNA